MHKTFDFSQAAEIDSANNARKASGQRNIDYAGGGICAALSAQWVALMRDEKSQGAGHRRDQLKSFVRTGGSLTWKMYADNWDTAADVKRNCSGLVRHAGSHSIVEDQFWDGMVPGAAVRDYMVGHPRHGVHFNFGFTGGSKTHWHAVAIWRSGSGSWPSGHMYFFDPNFGEYKGNKGEFASWLPDFLAEKYGNVVSGYLLLLEKAGAPKALKGLGARVM